MEILDTTLRMLMKAQALASEKALSLAENKGTDRNGKLNFSRSGKFPWMRRLCYDDWNLKFPSEAFYPEFGPHFADLI